MAGLDLNVDDFLGKAVALVTWSGLPDLTDDDRLLIPALRQHGVEAVSVAWDAQVDWTRFDQIILRSCWDYHLRATEFLEWIREIERLAVPLQNPASLVRWNTDKRYLRQLQVPGVRIPPTIWIEDQQEVSVHAILESRGWDSAVVKPTVSASAHRLKRVFRSDPIVTVRGPAMVQQFVPEVVAPGERSLVFLGGEFSHAVIKVPKPGDFRVQSEFGGVAGLTYPNAEMVETASKIVESLPGFPLYARVDGIQSESGFVLMEVELIEPFLFLALGRAVERFAEGILNFPARAPRLEPGLPEKAPSN